MVFWVTDWHFTKWLYGAQSSQCLTTVLQHTRQVFWTLGVSSARAVSGVGLQPLACSSLGFESSWGMDVCLLWGLCVTECGVSWVSEWVWSRNLDNEEALDPRVFCALGKKNMDTLQGLPDRPYTWWHKQMRFPKQFDSRYWRCWTMSKVMTIFNMAESSRCCT